MEKNININEFLFSRTRANKKLEVIKAMSDNDIRKTNAATMLRIYKECKKSGGDRFYIDSNRRVGNNWCSTIEFIYEWKGRPYLCLYVQNSSTDSSTSVSFDEFNRYNRYEGYCENLNKHFTYDSDDIARTIRCILSEYVYYKYIERQARENRERIESLLHYKIVNPVYDYFYDEWRCKYQGGYPGAPHDRLDRYYRAKKAVESYAAEHVNELVGKSTEELQTLYKKIFRETD